VAILFAGVASGNVEANELPVFDDEREYPAYGQEC
jgi:hypothetical protein